MTLKFRLEFSKKNFCRQNIVESYSYYLAVKNLSLQHSRNLNYVVLLAIVWSFSEISLYVDFCLVDI